MGKWIEQVRDIWRAVKRPFKRVWTELMKNSLFAKGFEKFRGFFRHYIIGLIDEIDRHHVFLNASGLAFTLIVCIIPFVLILFWILGTFLEGAEVKTQIDTVIDTLIPYTDYAQFVKDVIYARVAELVRYKNFAGYIGFFGLFFAASGFFSALRSILDGIYDVKTTVNIFLYKLWDFALILGVVMVFLVMILSLPIFETITTISARSELFGFIDFGLFHSVLEPSISFLIIFVLFMMMYKMVPLVKVKPLVTVIGSFYATLLWVAAKEIFGFYIYDIGSLGKIYGSYAIIVVVFFWIYYTAIVFIIGAIIGKLSEERKKKKLQSQMHHYVI